MPVKIQNLTNRPVLVLLNSGSTLHLAPNAVSEEMRDADINNNERVNKLLNQNVIALHQLSRSQTPPLKKIKKKKN